MNTSALLPGSPASRTLDHELAMVRGAIDLVASGVTSRVTLAGLRFAAQLIGPAREAASPAGVRVSPIWTMDDRPSGLSIQAATDARA